MTKPVVEGPLGSPPFEKLSISKGITNFVIFKYGSLVQKVLKETYFIVKTLFCGTSILMDGWFLGMAKNV